MLSTVRSVCPVASLRFLPTAPREKVPPSASCSPLSCASRPHHTQTNLIPHNPAVSFVASAPLPRTPQRNLASWRCLLGHLSDTRSPCRRPAHSHPLLNSSTWVPKPVRYWPFSVVRHCGTKFFCADLLLPLPSAPTRTYPDLCLDRVV